MRHAVEVRHASFRAPEFVALAREHGVAVIVDADSRVSADRRRRPRPSSTPGSWGRRRTSRAGYPAAALDALGGAGAALGGGRRGGGPRDGGAAGGAAEPRDVFLYVISGAKVRNPAAAMALIERVG